ncbi:MAG: aspartate--tRNA(Asn) ligase [Candidatus Hadarchaeia archaeon]
MIESNRLGKWRKSHYCSEIIPKEEGKEAVLMGWVEDIRDLGGIKFFNLRDSTGKVQITAPKSKVDKNVFDEFDSLNKESAIGVKGKIKKSDKAPGGVELIPEEIKEFGKAKTPLPLDPTGRVDADLDTRLDARPLDLRRPKPNAILSIKNHVLQIFRENLLSRGFHEVNTPKMVGSATESGTALFPIQYFDREAFLSQSPQLYKEVLVSSFEKVFEVGPVFRAEEHDTRYHLNEVLSGDLEMAYATKEDVMEILEELIINILQGIKNEAEKELETLEMEIEVPEKPLPRITYQEAINKLQTNGENISWGDDFSIPEQRVLGGIMGKPYFVVDWPTEEKPFYIMPDKEDERICEAFDLLYNEIELASGGTRIHQKDLLEERLKKDGLSPKQFDYHLKNFDWGMPPHAGWGLGIERLVMVITGADNIRECVLFPRDRKRLKP